MVKNEILLSAILPGVMMKSIPNVNAGMKVCCHHCFKSLIDYLHSTQTFG